MSAVLDLDGEFFVDPPPLLLFPLDIVWKLSNGFIITSKLRFDSFWLQWIIHIVHTAANEWSRLLSPLGVTKRLLSHHHLSTRTQSYKCRLIIDLWTNGRHHRVRIQFSDSPHISTATSCTDHWSGFIEKREICSLIKICFAWNTSEANNFISLQDHFPWSIYWLYLPTG